MDQYLPVDPASVYGVGLYGPRFWRDILRSEPIEVAGATTVAEPLSVEDAKRQCRVDTDVTEFDEWFDLMIPVARRMVQRDTGYGLVRATREMTFDRYPLERWIPLAYPPLVSITALYSTDVFNVETTVSSSTYYADTWTRPGRLILAPTQVWPTGTRNEQGGRVRWVSGFAAGDVPDHWVHALRLLVAHWFANREATARPKLDPTDLIPLGYDECIGDRRVGMG